jgi:hypothetical protein
LKNGFHRLNGLLSGKIRRLGEDGDLEDLSVDGLFEFLLCLPGNPERLLSFTKRERSFAPGGQSPSGRKRPVDL